MSISESVWAQTEGGRREARYASLDALFADLASNRSPEELLFLCIGTDRSSGDAFGPLVGSRLQEAGFPHVAGTLDALCDATNLERVVAGIPPAMTVVAFDACLGKPGSIGKFLPMRAPLTPAGSMKGNFAPVGDYSVAAVVNAYGPKPYQALQTASLRLVLELAEQASRAAAEAFGLRAR